MSNILNFGCYTILSMKETDHDYHIKVEVTPAPTECSECPSKNIVGGGRQETLVRDTPIHGKRVAIYVQARRIHCRDCKKTITEPLPEVHPGYRVTNRLYSYIGKKAYESTYIGVAEEVGVSEATVRRIFNEKRAAMADIFKFETPEWMGIDEIHCDGKYYCVITNIEHNKVFDLAVSRKQGYLVPFLYKRFTKAERASVKCVAMDMWGPYKTTIYGLFPNSAIVVDKFHVLSGVNYCLERVRIDTGNKLTPGQKRGLMRSRHILMKRPHNLTDEDKLLLDVWTTNFPRLKGAYEAKERFYRIYDCMELPEAEDAYMDWLRSLSDQTKEDFGKLLTTMGNWHHEIMMHFEHPVTNAYTESLNGLIRFIQREGRGYKFEALRAKILYNHGTHSFDAPKPERIPQGAWGYARMQFEMPSTQSGKLYGVDIATLLRFQEEGRL
jgi:transposase